MMRTLKKYYIDIYLQEIIYMLGWTPEQMKEYNGFFNINFSEFNFNKNGMVIFKTSGKGPIIIWTKMGKKDKDFLSTYHHEVLHASNVTLMRAGVIADFNNDEPQTYLSSAIFRKGLEK